jgi:hypothetical protein
MATLARTAKFSDFGMRQWRSERNPTGICMRWLIIKDGKQLAEGWKWPNSDPNGIMNLVGINSHPI